MSRTTTHATLLIGIALALTVGVGIAAAGTVGVSDRTVAVDERTDVAVTLEEAPDGLQRYNVTVSLDSADVARIDSASAGDVEGFQVRSASDDSVTFRAADLAEGVQAGATDVALGTVTLTGSAPGETDLAVTIHELQSDDGEQLDPETSLGTLTVQSDGDPAADRAEDGGDGTVQELSSSVPGTPIAWAGSGIVATLLVVVVVAIWRR